MNTYTPPTRAAALEQLARFVPLAGRDYASKRNYDLPEQGHPFVSKLSPYLRHRLISEEEVLQAVLGRYSLATAEKFVAEVCWRTYWKGWLELRPSAWADYRRDLDQIDRTGIAAAEAGRTEIDAFNEWARELVEMGYLHNHARMWFASIWIFTLELPWQAGADFFMRNLLDGDAASNTLSWRWVAGLQTHGKHYIARSSNISKYTEGRHNPEWRLNTQADSLSGTPHPTPRPMPKTGEVQQGVTTAVLLHNDDLSPSALIDQLPENVIGLVGLLTVSGRSPFEVNSQVTGFARGAMDDAMARWGARFGGAGPVSDEVSRVVEWAKSKDVEQIVTPFAPVGPAASALRRLQSELSNCGIGLVQIIRPWDLKAWPHATHGFFRFKKHIPGLVSELIL